MSLSETISRLVAACDTLAMVPCQVCGKPHDPHRNPYREAKTCSRRCASTLLWRTARAKERELETRECVECRRPYKVGVQQRSDEKHGRKGLRRYCSLGCMARATSISKDGFCVAPCIPRCPHRAEAKHGLCQGHDKRRDRRRPIDTLLVRYG